MIFACCISAVVFAAMFAAELIHARRIGGISRLVFGPRNRSGLLARMAPVIRVISVSGMTWGIATLLTLPAEHFDHGSSETPIVDPTTLKRVVLLLDVSPSMDIVDADHNHLTRRGRAATVILDILSRFSFDRSRVSVLDFFGDAKPIVIDTIDPNVVRHIIWNDDVSLGFDDGQTDLIKAISTSFDLVKDWRPGSTTLVVLTDGDSDSTQPLPRKPIAIDQVIFVGVGDPNHGTPIHGHLSRQDSGNLQQLAARLSGTYFDANEHLLPTDLLADSTGPMSESSGPFSTLRTAALVAIAVCSIVLLGLPIGLAFYGRIPGRRLEIMAPSAPAKMAQPGAA